MKILLLHGRCQEHNSPDAIILQWLSSLNKGLASHGIFLKRSDVVLPYYGNQLADLVDGFYSPISGVASKGDISFDVNEIRFDLEILSEIINNYDSGGLKLIDQDGLFVEKGILNHDAVHRLLKVLDSTPLGGLAIRCFVRDVYAYLVSEKIREIIHNIVIQSMCAESYIIVAHSLGSIIAYNVLRTFSKKISIDKIITIGSPLGISAIKRRIERPILMPSVIKEWINIRDCLDVVALYPLDKFNFNTIPPIKNYNVLNSSEDRHGVDGYLENDIVADAIFESYSHLDSV